VHAITPSELTTIPYIIFNEGFFLYIYSRFQEIVFILLALFPCVLLHLLFK